MTNIDIKENNLYRLDSRLLEILLVDRTTKKNLIWATDNYSSRGPGYKASDNINVYAIIKRNGSIIKPRVEKSKMVGTTISKRFSVAPTMFSVQRQSGSLLKNLLTVQRRMFIFALFRTFAALLP